MNILIVTTSLPRWIGDSRAPFILEIARALQRKGHLVRILAMHAPKAKTYEKWDGIEIYRPRYLFEKWEILQSEDGGLPEIWKSNLFSRLVIVPFIFVHTINIIRLAKDVDIIHSNWTLSAFSAWVTKFIHKKPIVVTVQGSDIFIAARMPLIRNFTKFALNGCDNIVALSRAISKEILSLGIPSKKVHIIPNGVNTNKFLAGEDFREPIILFVGSLIERKDPFSLLFAFKGIVDQVGLLRLVFIGDGPLRKSLEETTVKIGLASNVDFLGNQPQEQVRQWMKKAKVLVLPSVEEGLGVVLLEALASGTPCVASNVGGIPDIINEDVGILVSPHNPQAMQSAINELINDDEYWKKLSKNARKKAEILYDWDNVVEKIIALYSHIVN